MKKGNFKLKDKIANTKLRRLAILGSTGSIGVQVLKVIDMMKNRFQINALAARGNKIDLLAKQAVKVKSKIVGVFDKKKYHELVKAIKLEIKIQEDGKKQYDYRPEIIAGSDILNQIVSMHDLDMVVNSLDGSIGLEPTLKALKNDHILALANKESLVVGGSLITDLAKSNQIIPIDSEHSALKECLKAGSISEVDRLILTASGGPLYRKNIHDLRLITLQDTLKHPIWNMGRTITINSSSLVNKGLEIIEAHILFNMPVNQIDVVIHPQAIVHSMVQFTDGSIIAQCYPPSMLLSINNAINWPKKIPGISQSCRWNKFTQWTFEPVNEKIFQSIKLARYAMQFGKTFPAVYNAANEQAVKAFSENRIPFLYITRTIEAVLSAHTSEDVFSVASIQRAEKWAKVYAENYFKYINK